MSLRMKSGSDIGQTCHNSETCESSRREKASNAQTLSVEGPLAKTYLAQGHASELVESVLGCFWRWSESFASYSRGMWFGKTSGVLFPLTEEKISEPCLGIFPTSGMMRNGQCYALQTSEHRIVAQESSYWPTPMRYSPEESITTWEIRSERWKRRNSSVQKNLYVEAIRLHGRLSQRMTKNGRKSLANAHTCRRRLNPIFVEWLMGFPLLWTMPDFKETRR